MKKFVIALCLCFSHFVHAQQAVVMDPSSDYHPMDGRFNLPELPFELNSVSKVIDEKTMNVHYYKHHGKYVENLNLALNDEKFVAYQNFKVEDICTRVKPEEIAIRNNAGGHFNHSFFWNCINPNYTSGISKNLNEAISKSFGSVDRMNEQILIESQKLFGSGWVWLCTDREGKLFIVTTPNQDNPLMRNCVTKPGQPLMCIDLWEHAYYLNYLNDRAQYVKSVIQIINWEFVSSNYDRIKQ